MAVKRKSTKFDSKKAYFFERTQIIFAIIAAIIPIFVLITGRLSSNFEAVKELQVQNRINDARETQVDSLKKQIKDLDLKIETLSLISLDSLNYNAPSKEQFSLVQEKLSQIDIKVDNNSKSIKKFEGLLITDAERLISLPLLKTEIQSIQNDFVKTEKSISNLSALLVEMNNQNRFLIGSLTLGLFAVAITLVIPVLKGLTNQGKQREEPNEIKKESD